MEQIEWTHIVESRKDHQFLAVAGDRLYVGTIHVNLSYFFLPQNSASWWWGDASWWGRTSWQLLLLAQKLN